MHFCRKYQNVIWETYYVSQYCLKRYDLCNKWKLKWHVIYQLSQFLDSSWKIFNTPLLRIPPHPFYENVSHHVIILTFSLFFVKYQILYRYLDIFLFRSRNYTVIYIQFQKMSMKFSNFKIFLVWILKKNR